ncbi:glycosyltransferase family 2 protein [Ureibacillus terrenus]|uniref:glycosyltransferase family 2 protein n=1 Tax=Ureibacillus terrenus TaxID=118246 RepID=UPI002E1D9A63|nr:glycosyltransferase family 2 protein [Ureibacillus terrenus]
MGNEFLFSIIIPVYNTEKHLHQCLESVINQSYSNIEVILVNDGSTDNSGVICEEISKIDNRVKVFHTKNRGVSSARNLGLSKATGDYVIFIDSDDWLEKNALESIFKVLQYRLYDLVIFGMVKEIGNKIIPMYPFQESKSYISKKEIECVLPQLISMEIVNSPIKIYKSDLIKKMV